jgi:endonuclease/exonuclease/phosphatase family metal-dependent hydrolase
MQIKLMSFNTQNCKNFITQKLDYDVMAEAIRKCNADIIGLNEMCDEGTGAPYEAQTKILAEKLGYPYYYFAVASIFRGVNPFGNALISKYPIISTEIVSIPIPEVRGYAGYYEDRCLLKAVVDVEGTKLNVLVIHFGLNQDEAENAVKAVMANLPGENTVLMGDFNLTPDSPLLLPIQERMFDTAELFAEDDKIAGETRSAAPIFTNEEIMQKIKEAAVPATTKLSFPSDAPKVKIDYILTSPDVKVLCADIPAIVASDHRPHTAEIKL